MNPWIVGGVLAGVLYLAGKYVRRTKGVTGPESPFQTGARGADALFFELKDGLGAPLEMVSAHEAQYAGMSGGPAIPFGN